jgi:hypothetical protein
LPQEALALFAWMRIAEPVSLVSHNIHLQVHFLYHILWMRAKQPDKRIDFCVDRECAKMHVDVVILYVALIVCKVHFRVF